MQHCSQCVYRAGLQQSVFDVGGRRGSVHGVCDVMSTNFHMMFLRGRPISAPHADGFCSVRVRAGFSPEMHFRPAQHGRRARKIVPPGARLAVEYEEGCDVGLVYVAMAADADAAVVV